MAQSDVKPGDKAAQGQPVDAEAQKEAQKRLDEFAEAARVVSGPAGNAECVWLGRRVIRWLQGDDLDTAVRNLDLYDRFGCPGPHIQSAFRCLLRQTANLDTKDPKNTPALNARVNSCWLNPVTTNAAAPPSPAGSATMAAQPAVPAATQGGTPGGAASGGAASSPTNNQAPAAKPPGTPGR